MAYLAVLAIAAANSAGLFVLSLLAVGGDGSAKAIHQIWLIGYPWIAVFTVAALVLVARERRALAQIVVSSTLPAGFVALVAAMNIDDYWRSVRANPPAFDLACKDAGAKFTAPPAQPVTSIAFDWEPRSHLPDHNYLLLDERGNITETRWTAPRFPGSIRFAEWRCCKREGRPTQGSGPYIRRPNTGTMAYYAIAELTADALATYRVSKMDMRGTEAGVQVVEITVTDRRDRQTLATLRYLIDRNARRACGSTAPGVMDETRFVLQAVGAGP